MLFESGYHAIMSPDWHEIQYGMKDDHLSYYLCVQGEGDPCQKQKQFKREHIYLFCLIVQSGGSHRNRTLRPLVSHIQVKKQRVINSWAQLTSPSFS